jgi:predicted metal-binding membrane protein
MAGDSLTATAYITAVAAWLGMMVLMMLPALWPWLTLFSRMAPRAYPGRRPVAVVAQFGAGYLAVWLAYSAAAAALQLELQRLALLRVDLSMSATGGGLVLLLAGSFQLTPLKDACLSHCRSPLGFFLARWDGGAGGPFRMGARHGAFCVGCCWALMALMFVLGLMNLLWMGFITVVLVVEQRAPSGWRVHQALGVGLAAWGVALLLIG